MGPVGLAGRMVSSLAGAASVSVSASAFAAGVGEDAVHAGDVAVSGVNVQTGMGGRTAPGAKTWHWPA